MTPWPLEILLEDNHCLAIAKPAGALATHYQGSEETLDRQVKSYLKEKYCKTGNVFLGVVHRLDRPVSGVLLFARTSKAAARLAEQFREGTTKKLYWAVVEGILAKNQGSLLDWLKKNPRTGSVEVCDPATAEARRAALEFHSRGSQRNLTWLEVRPQTGRTHQIRAQLSHQGHPVYGDTRYGSIHRFGRAIALHARSLAFEHPVRREVITLTANLPAAWRSRFAGLVDEERA